MSGGGNGIGPTTVMVNRERDFAIFDELPPHVRRAMNDALFSYGAAEVMIGVRRYGADVIAAYMPTMDRRILAKEAAGAAAA